jgi:hypothetical protein
VASNSFQSLGKVYMGDRLNSSILGIGTYVEMVIVTKVVVCVSLAV